MGWYPPDFDLKDHTVFSHNGLYYIASNYLAADESERWFAYASSPDLCNWTDLGPILADRTPGAWDESAIWAPHVYEEDGVHYMFYTGVTFAVAQSIMLATSADPADPGSWVPQGVMFQPSHPEMVWGGFGVWSDCRDPTVTKIGSLYHMHYTGLDTSGGIVGLATAPSLFGPWTDWGAVAGSSTSMPESAAVAEHNGLYYLFYNDSEAQPLGLGEVYQYGPTIAGPWSDRVRFRPGWAHEIWTGMDGQEYTSFLSNGDILIRPLSWSQWGSPPRPIIGMLSHSVVLPLVAH